MRSCLDEGELVEFFAGRLGRPEHEAIEHHVDECPSCLDLIANVAASIAGATDEDSFSLADTESLITTATLNQWPELKADEPAILRWGTLIGGRYEVHRIIGVGGMGIVYSCRDQNLEREVALKVLRSRPSTVEEVVRAEKRLLREAQILAGLSHPNIVAVFDVGSDDGLVFIAMELVRGKTLGAWLEASPPPHKAILEVFVAAGRGLAAAHAAGVVHSDFKPANVLVGDDGRIRVTDFGLASSHAGDFAAAHSEEASEHERRSGATSRERGWFGTPRYMSPEQLSGAAASTASDQFGFTLALAQGLLGGDPFPAVTLEERLARIVEGPVLSGPSGSLSPSVRRLLRRGLDARPSDRYPSMEALCDDLDRIRRGRQWRLWSALGLSLVAVVTLVVLRVMSPATTCQKGEQLIFGVWNPEVREQITTAVGGREDTEAVEVWRRVEARFDRSATRWTGVYSEACVVVSDERSTHRERERALDQMTCLEWALAYLGGSAALAEMGDTDVLRALEKKGPLPSILDRCERGIRYVTPLPEHPAVQARVIALRLRLSDATPLMVAGEMERAGRLVEAIELEAKTIHFTPLIIEVLHFRGKIELHRGELDQAAATLERALDLSEQSGHDTFISELWLELALVDTSRGQLDGAARAIKRADAFTARGALPVNIRILLMRAHLLRALGRHHAVLEVVREMRELAVGDIEMARVLVSESLSRSALGEWKQALLLQRQVLALRIQALDEGHSRIAGAHNLVGESLFALGEIQGAEEHLLCALEIRERLGEGADLERSRVLLNVGRLAQAQEEPARALHAVVEALEIREARLGGEHPEVAEALMYVGEIHCAQGNVSSAIPLLRRAHRILDRLYGPGHPQTALALVARVEANLEADSGATALDLTELGRALGVLELAEIRPDERAHARSVVERARVVARYARR